MNVHNEKLNPFFQQAKGTSECRAAFYVDWPNRFLKFDMFSLNEASEYYLKAFGQYLGTEWQCYLVSGCALIHFWLNTYTLLRNP
jgi:hypothetical protein